MYSSTICKLLLLSLALLVACDSGERKSAHGTITLDGNPLAEGSISLRPEPGTKGPTAGAKITDGTYAVDSKDGTFVGTFRVEISASRKTGRQVLDTLTGMMVDEYEQIIPERYNQESELKAEVTEEGANEFNFELISE